MPADLLDHPRAANLARLTPDAAFAARPRLLSLRDALRGAARNVRPRWGEPPVFFFDPKRQTELEATRPTRPDRFAELGLLIQELMPAIVASVEVRRVARAAGVKEAARVLAPYCSAADDLAELLAVPDDEVFLAIVPATRTGVRLHLRGVACVAQLHRLLASELKMASFQLFQPTAIQPDGTLPEGLAGCGHWLWPEQPLGAVPRDNGEHVVLVGPAAVIPSLVTEIRFPELAVECERIETLGANQVAETLSRMYGCTLPLLSVARAA